MADSAGSAPYSWLVDPAVLHALARLAQRQPAAHPHSRPRRCPVRNPHPSSRRRTASETPTTPGETLAPTQPVPAEEPTDEEAQLAASAAAWLERFRLLVGATPVLTLPYGDIDVSAVDPQRPHPLRPGGRPRRRGDGRPDAAVPADRGAGERPAEPRGHRGHAHGHDDPAGGQRLRHPADQPDLRRPAARARGGGHEHRRGGGRSRPRRRPTTPSRCASGCSARRPSASRPDDTAPLVVTLPTVWRGEDAASFFTDLEQSWLDLVPLGDVAARTPKGVPAASLTYTDDDIAEELGPEAFSAANRAGEAATAAGAGAHPGDDHRGAGARRGAGHPVRAAPRATRAGRRRGRAGRGRDARRPRQDRDRGTPRGHPLQRLRTPRRRPSSTASTSRSRCGSQVRTDGELTLSGWRRTTSRPRRAQRRPVRGHHQPGGRAQRPPRGHQPRRHAARVLRLAAHPRRPGERAHLDRDGSRCARAVRDDRLPPARPDQGPSRRAGRRRQRARAPEPDRDPEPDPATDLEPAPVDGPAAATPAAERS